MLLLSTYLTYMLLSSQARISIAWWISNPALIGKLFLSSISLESDNNRCQYFGVGSCVPVPHSPENVVIDESQTLQHLGAQSSKTVSTTLDHLLQKRKKRRREGTPT